MEFFLLDYMSIAFAVEVSVRMGVGVPSFLRMFCSSAAFLELM
jgi:hypothetical protein